MSFDKKLLLFVLVLADPNWIGPALGGATGSIEPPHRRGEVREIFRSRIVVDGLPVMHYEQQVWTGILWAPLGSDDATRALMKLPPIRGRRE